MYRTLLALIAFTVLTGCVTNYQYRSQGQISYENGHSLDAVIFWHKDEGRLWYLKKYEQWDSDVVMRICGKGVIKFELTDDIVQIPSGRNDYLVARLDDSGAIQPQESKQLVEGSSCGVIQVNGESVGTDGLPVNVRPEIVILCRNERNSTRYPLVTKYPFDVVSRRESSPEREAPKPCLASQ